MKDAWEERAPEGKIKEEDLTSFVAVFWDNGTVQSLKVLRTQFLMTVHCKHVTLPVQSTGYCKLAAPVCTQYVYVNMYAGAGIAHL